MDWIAFPDTRIAVDGLPWFSENSPHLWRLPARMKNVVRAPVWDLARHASGCRLRFRSDTTELGLRVRYPESDAPYPNMSAIGQKGIDVYLDGLYACSFAPAAVSEPQAGADEEMHVEGLESDSREISIYLPNYSSVEIVAVGLADDADISDPEPYAAALPVVYYGSSITQGGCASRPGMSYQAILGRLLAVDFVNLGFSGNGMGEPELAEAMAEIEASCYVLDFAVNLPSPEEVEKVYGPFLQILRDRRPEVPVICVTPIYLAGESWSGKAREKLGRMRDVIRKAVAERVHQGDTAVRLIEGYSLLGPDVADGFVDGVHPNDVGFIAMAEGLTPHVAEAVEGT